VSPGAVRLLGLVGSILLCELGRTAFFHVQAARVRQLPPEWREHPQLVKRYDAALRHSRPFAWVVAWRKAWTLPTCVAVFGLAALAGASIGFELLWAFSLALIWGAGRLQATRAQTGAIAVSEGLPALAPRSRGAYAAWFSSYVLLWFGGLAACAFLGMLVALPAA
jgi:hypothetical protein